MTRDRPRQIVIAVIGLLCLGVLYPLSRDLWHSYWLLQMHGNEMEPMFLSFAVGLGVFLLLAARNPAEHRFFIAFAAVANLLHAAVMAIETLQARSHGVRRDYLDVIIFTVIGCVLLIAMPPKQKGELA